MKVHELELTSQKNKKRVGRGISAGQGKTAGRGTKGQNSRTGGGVRPGFEGGQNPLAKRLPKKRGFASLSPTNYQVINVSQLASFKGVIDQDALLKAGLIKHGDQDVKLLADGELTIKVDITVQAASKTARGVVEKAGGTLTIAALPKKKSKKATRTTT